MITKIIKILITEISLAIMIKKIKDIKKKIKLVKIWAIILGIIFILLIINSICLTYKVKVLETQIENLE